MAITVDIPNKFYCLGNEEGEFRSNQQIGIMCFRETFQSSSFHAYLEREAVEAMSTEQKLLHFFHLIGHPFNVIDTFINVDSKDVFFASLSFENSKFFLVDSKFKEQKINEIVVLLNSYDTQVAIATAEQLPNALIEFKKAQELYYDELIKLCGVNA